MTVDLRPCECVESGVQAVDRTTLERVGRIERPSEIRPGPPAVPDWSSAGLPRLLSTRCR